jgi:hypothetical protein
MLSYLGNDLLRAIRTRPLVSVAVSGDRYSVGYSAPRERVACGWRQRSRRSAVIIRSVVIYRHLRHLLVQ